VPAAPFVINVRNPQCFYTYVDFGHAAAKEHAGVIEPDKPSRSVGLPVPHARSTAIARDGSGEIATVLDMPLPALT
jgi:hypothetical protein